MARENLCNELCQALQRDQKMSKSDGMKEKVRRRKRSFSQTCKQKRIRVFFVLRVFVSAFDKSCLIIIASRKDLAHCLWIADLCVRSLDILGRG